MKSSVEDIIQFLESACLDIAVDEVEAYRNGIKSADYYKFLETMHYDYPSADTGMMVSAVADRIYSDVDIITDLVGDQLHGAENRNEVLEELATRSELFETVCLRLKGGN